MEAFFYAKDESRFIQFGKTLQFLTQILEIGTGLDLE